MRLMILIFILTLQSTFKQNEKGVSFACLDTKEATPNVTKANTDTFHYFSIHDTSIKPYCLPDNFIKPEKWVAQENSRIEYELYGRAYPDTFNLQDALGIIDTARNFETICSAKSWCLKNYQTVFPYLVTRLSIKQKVGLENTADLIIWERNGTGELEFYGHGGAIEEDIFTIAGRASWILNEMTGERFAVVHGNMSEIQALEFKKLWTSYINALK